MNKLSDIQYWIFDLDNTLYCSSTNVFGKIDKKMCEYIMEKLNVSRQEALKIKDQYFHEHGTTLNGLMQKHNIDATHFLEFVHNIDYDFLKHDEMLNQAIKKLPGEKIIFTNGSKKHAIRVIEKLGIDSNFEKIFDIVDSDYIPKPDINPYKKLISTFKIQCSKAILFDDIAKNLEPAHALGMRTAWVENNDPYCRKGFDSSHVHYRVKNLKDFLLETNKIIS
jgi:putative hydrolase of the HAD superfamily